jgi:hypothetical protein
MESSFSGKIDMPRVKTDFLVQFHGWCAAAIDAEGIWPLPGQIVQSDGMVVAFALDLDPGEIMNLMTVEAAKPGVVEAAFALDRFAKPGQDVEYEDLLTVYHWTAVTGWRLAVVEYRPEPKDVRPYDWDNAFWLKVCANDLATMNQRTTAYRLIAAH